jgi:uncharacterized protein YciI
VPLFLVRYRYTDDAEAQDLVRPKHRAWLGSLGSSLVGSGPTADNGAALVFDLDSTDAVNELLDADPFAVGGFIADRQVVEWTLRSGRWAQSV